MNELIINPAKTIAITGHRAINADFDREKLKNTLKKFIEKGFDTFLIGMAVGFDTMCFQELEKLKEEKKDIRIIACIPCLTQSERFSKSQREEYERLLSIADDKILISKEYTKNCMQKRNEFMVNYACCVFAYLKRDFGGTKNTVEYAKKLNKMIVYTD